MNSSLRILLLEDDSAFEKVLSASLRNLEIPCHLTRVETQDDFMSQLRTGAYDLILSDYSLPGFDGLTALQLVRSHCPHIPFIFVSGTMGEELAIDSLQQGATDYVLKHRLSRLAPAVRRALQDAKHQREKQHLEAQLIQAQKMESIGQLAGGLAHDFNNVLSIVRGNVELLIEGKNLNGRDADNAQKILHSVARANRITKQLLTFSRKQEMEQDSVDLNTIIDSFVHMTGRLLGHGIKITCDLKEGGAMIRADAGMMEQVLLNLAINARDAMPDGGELRISTNIFSIRGDDVRGNPQAIAGKTVCLRFEDTGGGIPPEILPRIFEPFFTTKGSTTGTGMGLASVYGIIKQHRGWIEVQSDVAKGTIFQIFLPCDTSSPHNAAVDEHFELPTGSETVLVVEDEKDMRDLVRNILELCGYHVLDAATGSEALELWKNRKDDIHVVITDLILADGITGLELARQLKPANGHLNVIFTSGYSIRDIGKDAEHLREGQNFLQKPFQAQKLAQTIRMSLDH